jgi:hypothetical protein
MFSLEQRPLPLGNPFFADEKAGPVYYYHFFYLMPATVRAIAGGPSIEAAFAIQSLLVAAATVAMFYLLAFRLFGGVGPASLAAVLAALVGGWDVIPLAYFRMRVVTLDAWADHLVRIHPFLNQMMWSPQNVMGVTIVLLGVYILSARGWWRGCLALGPLLIASLFGTSVWVAVPAFAGLAVFVLFEMSHVKWAGERRASGRLLAGACVVAVSAFVICLPVIQGYRDMSERHGKSLTAQWPYQEHALLGRLVPPGPLANLLDLPWVMLLEFGPLAVLPWMLSSTNRRRAFTDPGMRYLAWAGSLAVVGFVLVRSHFLYNDFGQKSMLVAMSAGLLLGTGVLNGPLARPRWWNPLGWSVESSMGSPARRTMLGCLVAGALLIGLPLSLYEAPLTAARRFFALDGRLRELVPKAVVTSCPEGASYRFARTELPAGEVLQAWWGQDRANLVQLTRHQMGVAELEADTMVFYPVDTQTHAGALSDIQAAFHEGTSAADSHRLLKQHGITHVFLGATESAKLGALAQFLDLQYFTPVYRDAAVTILALTPAVAGK